MIGCFPDPYPDELLYSVCARYQERMVYSKDTDVVRNLFGVRTKTFNIAYPNCLQHLISVLPPGHNYSIERLIYENTLANYFQAFLQPAYIASCQKTIGQNDPVANWTLEDIPIPNSLRFCSACAAADKKQYGESYWHRLHQIAGVEVCPRHHIFLQPSSVYINSKYKIAEFRTATEAINTVAIHSLDSSNPSHKILLRVAEDTAWLLNNASRSLEEDCLSNCYINLLANQGYIDNGKLNRVVWLKDYLQQYSRLEPLNQLQFKKYGYRTEYPEEKKRLLRAELGFHLLDRFLLSPSQNHPLRHLLMIHFLGYKLNDFFHYACNFQRAYEREYSEYNNLHCLNCNRFGLNLEYELYLLKCDFKTGFYQGKLYCFYCGFPRKVKFSVARGEAGFIFFRPKLPRQPLAISP